MNDTPRAADFPVLGTLFDHCTRAWSPRQRIRIDPSRTHDYASTASMPATAPAAPWAIYLAGTDRRYRLLAFDFDSGRHGADVANADATRICAHLSELGVPHLRAHSGPTGGQHVWVRLAAPGADADDVRQLGHALRQHYPSLDTAPLSNAVTGAVRPPGAPHRHGGHSLPHPQHQAIDDVLARMAHGTAPEVVGWLLARHPHTVTVTREGDTRVVRIVEDGAGPRLDRPRRALSERTRTLLAIVPPPGTDRSALAHSILLGMACAGHTLADVRRAVEAAPGLARLREDVARARGRDEIARQWQRALETAAEFAPASVVERGPVDDDLDRVQAAVTAVPARWARPGGASDERILHALIVVARTARTRTVDIDVRRLAEAAAVDASTVSRRLRVLASEGWVIRVRAGAGTRAATWELNLPEVDATQGEPAPAPTGTSPTLLHHHTHDVWTNRTGLGGAAARIHWAATNFGKHTFSASHRIPLAQFVSAATGYTTATVTRTLAHLRTFGLLPARSSTQSKTQMDRAADLIGTAGTAARRTLRHLVDRELHRWWTEETEWRARRGKKRGTRAISTNTIALPITAPARTRYGRFPTTAARRADYRAARAIVADALDISATRPEAA
ncbi:hypothetical protein M2284_005300 [Rhodococcus sp. LBL1]|nr:hypothetical protein [Rhodococcus sp. LBL1]MDH6686363.1 hypothetical protein [Rhodococcus sp. LBL2]